MASGEAAAIQYQFDHYYQNRASQDIAGILICIVASSTAVALRIYAQSLVGKAYTPDSVFILLALAFVLANDFASSAAFANGLGKHQIRVLREDPDPPSQTFVIFHTGWAVTWISSLSVKFTKLAILYLYKVVFTTFNRLFKWALYITALFSVLLGIGSTLDFIFQCVPVSCFWNCRVYILNQMKTPSWVHGWCMPQKLHLAFPIIADLVTDVAILILPLLVLRKLQMSMRRKVAIYFTFSMGIFVCGVGVVRIYYSINIGNAVDVSWNNANSFIWTSVQIFMGVICSCVPASAPLLRYFPKKGGSSWRNSKYRLKSGTETWTSITQRKLHFHSQSQKGGDDDSVKNFASTNLPSESGKELDLEDYGGSSECNVTGSPSHGRESRGIPLDSIKVFKDVDVTRG